MQTIVCTAWMESELDGVCGAVSYRRPGPRSAGRWRRRAPGRARWRWRAPPHAPSDPPHPPPPRGWAWACPPRHAPPSSPRPCAVRTTPLRRRHPCSACTHTHRHGERARTDGWTRPLARPKTSHPLDTSQARAWRLPAAERRRRSRSEHCSRHRGGVLPYGTVGRRAL